MDKINDKEFSLITQLFFLLIFLRYVCMPNHFLFVIVTISISLHCPILLVLEVSREGESLSHSHAEQLAFGYN